jgi:uncharacterized protein
MQSFVAGTVFSSFSTNKILLMLRDDDKKEKSKRGFASMSKERQREIAAMGGRAAHELGVAHEWNTDEASTAGKKGGQASGLKNRRSQAGHDELL